MSKEDGMGRGVQTGIYITLIGLVLIGIGSMLRLMGL